MFVQCIDQDGTILKRPNFPKKLESFQYLYLVLGTEAIVKLIMEKENCNYQTANKLACLSE
jgi:hypothetical protein